MTQVLWKTFQPPPGAPTYQIQAKTPDGLMRVISLSQTQYDAFQALMAAQAKADAAKAKRRHARLLKTAWWWLEELVLDFTDTVLTVGPDGQWTPHPQAPVEEGYGEGFDRTYPGAAVRKLLKMRTLIVIEHDENGKPLAVRAPANGDDE